MARLRSNLRQAMRFGGDGQQYDVGYRYDPPDRVPLVFGPWDRIMPHGRRTLPETALAQLHDGILNDGMILPIWSRTSVPVSDRRIIGTFDISLLLDNYHAIFFRDNVDTLWLELRSATTSVLFDTGITTTTEEITAVGWNNDIYFGFPDATHIWEFDTLSDTLTEITDAPSVTFLFVLDNNLCAVVQDGPYLVYWSVDGDPTDWSGFGSGSEIVPASVGAVQGTAALTEGRLIAGRDGAWFMSSTHTIPPFRFEEVNDFPGVGFYKAVVGAYGRAYFIGQDKKIAAYTLGQNIDIGVGEGLVLSDPMLYHSKSLNSVVISSSEPEQTLFLDLNTNQWKSTLPFYFSHIVDSPVGAAEHGSVIGIIEGSTTYEHDRVTLDLVTDEATMPSLKTGLLRFGQPLLVHYIDIEHNNLIDYAPLVNVNCLMEDGSIFTRTFSEFNRAHILIQGNIARYYIDQPCYGIEIETHSVEEGDGFYHEDDLNATGNLVSDLISKEGYLRGNLNGAGNLVPVADGLYTFGQLTAFGNVEMTIEVNQWPIEIGIDRIKAYVRTTQNAPDSGGR